MTLPGAHLRRARQLVSNPAVDPRGALEELLSFLEHREEESREADRILDEGLKRIPGIPIARLMRDLLYEPAPIPRELQRKFGEAFREMLAGWREFVASVDPSLLQHRDPGDQDRDRRVVEPDHLEQPVQQDLGRRGGLDPAHGSDLLHRRVLHHLNGALRELLPPLHVCLLLAAGITWWRNRSLLKAHWRLPSSVDGSPTIGGGSGPGDSAAPSTDLFGPGALR